MNVKTFVLFTAFNAFGAVAQAQTCDVLCDENFLQMASDAEIAAEILKADVNARNDYGGTALMLAVPYRSAPTMKLLLDAGAVVNARSEGGYTALMLAASLEKADPAMVKLLLDAGAEVNARNEYGGTALMVAAYVSTEIVKLLLDAGAEINATAQDGTTALILAVRSGSADTVKVLLDAGADASSRDVDGKTAWDLAQEIDQIKGTDAYWMLNDAQWK